MTVCEMCGKSTELMKAEIEGVELNVCNSCAKFGKVKRSFQGSRSSHSSFSSSHPVKQESPSFRIVSNFAQQIRTARERNGLNHEDFAKFLNERESVVAKWEHGDLRPPVELAQRLGKKLGLTLVEKDEDKMVEVEKQRKNQEEFTLGDFIKVRKRG